MCNFWSVFLLIFAGILIGFVIAEYHNEKGKDRWEAEVFRVYIQRLINMQTDERKRYDDELAKLKKLKADRVVFHRTGYPRTDVKSIFKLDESETDCVFDAQWANVNPNITDALAHEIEQHIARLKDKGEVVYTPPFMAPDGTWRFDIGVIPKEET